MKKFLGVTLPWLIFSALILGLIIWKLSEYRHALPPDGYAIEQNGDGEYRWAKTDGSDHSWDRHWTYRAAVACAWRDHQDALKEIHQHDWQLFRGEKR